MSGTTRLRHRLVDNLREHGHLHETAWIEAFRTVPRHVFLPRFFVRDGDRWAAVSRDDPGALETIYSQRVLATQLDDDPSRWETARRDGPVEGAVTSSSSEPAIMAIMLEELRVTDRCRVLEIGTGTGYNAALLCHRLGAGQVSTVDIDASLVADARTRLAECGYVPSCEAADGAEGFPAGVLFERVLCTASVNRIPPAWLAQTLPGGFVVTTLNRPLGAGLVRVTAGDGATGRGHVLARNGRFMPLRAHRREEAALPASDDLTWRRTRLPIGAMFRERPDFEFFAGLALPDVSPVRDEDGRIGLVHPDGSWVRQRERAEIAQGGPRALWDLAERAYLEWCDLGKPASERFGVDIDGEHQEFWLDSPSGRRWPLA